MNRIDTNPSLSGDYSIVGGGGTPADGIVSKRYA
jgi:hypothetical protein